MTSSDIKTARLARRDRIEQLLKDWQISHPPAPSSPASYTPLSPTERAAIVAKENSKPVPQGCCGH